MFIAINGQLGSGKSELCKRLNSEYGFEIFHTGRIQREFAAELGISTLELNERCKQDHHYDKIIDSRLVEHAEKMRGKNVVFDSRMAWHFVKGAFKVHLLVAPDIAADRVFFHRVAEEERYSSKEEAMKNLMERRRTLLSMFASANNAGTRTDAGKVAIHPDEIVITDRDESLIKKVIGLLMQHVFLMKRKCVH